MFFWSSSLTLPELDRVHLKMKQLIMKRESADGLNFGSVTGRQRRAAPFDMELAKKSIRLNSATHLALTKLDVVFPNCAGVREYLKLSADARQFVENIEQETGLKVTMIGTGEELTDIIDRSAHLFS